MGRLIVIALCICLPAVAADYTFVQVSDTQIGLGGQQHDTRAWSTAVDHINTLDVAFVLVTGDMAHVWNEQDQIDAFLAEADRLTAPFYVVPGNHDVGVPSQFQPTPESLLLYRDTYGPDFYSFWTQGDLFIAVNTNFWRHPESHDAPAQRAWLLARLRDAQGLARRVVVFGHHPLFTRSVDEPLDSANIAPDQRARLLDWFETYGVTHYLAGHVHKNLVFDYHGITLIVTAATSVNLGPPGTRDPLGFRIFHAGDRLFDRYTAIRSADVDFDGDVDLTDYAAFTGCSEPPLQDRPPACAAVDLDADQDVDLVDFGILQARFAPP